MKSNIVILFLLILLMSFTASATPDSLQTTSLDAKLAEYFRAMEREDLEVQKEECDYIIESAQNPELRQRIAEKVYDHYMESTLMGFEGVAVHVFDKWFAGKGLKMGDEMKQLNARIYADFNRSSLLGCKAPDLKMQTMQGDSLTVFPSGDRRYRVLYFYDTDCVKCKAQTILLRNLLNTKNYPLDFYAIYVGDNKSAWEKYSSGHLNVDAPATLVHHLWDKTLSSDFQRKYGILQTPRMFLIAPDGVIVGRGLDAYALAQMLHQIFDSVELEYGSQESASLYDAIFAGDVPSESDVKALADQIADLTLPKGDTVMFRQMTGDLLYYLSSRSGEGFKEGLGYLIDTYIYDNTAWRSQDDSLKVVGFAGIMKDLLSKAKPGTRIADLKVPGVKVTRKGEKAYKRNLRKLGADRNIIIFYTEGCHICDAEKKAARELAAADKNVSVLMVNVDDILRTNQSLASKLFDSFDLSSLPYILETSRKGLIQRRYTSVVSR